MPSSRSPFKTVEDVVVVDAVLVGRTAPEGGKSGDGQGVKSDSGEPLRASSRVSMENRARLALEAVQPNVDPEQLGCSSSRFDLGCSSSRFAIVTTDLVGAIGEAAKMRRGRPIAAVDAPTFNTSKNAKQVRTGYGSSAVGSTRGSTHRTDWLPR